MADSLYRRWLGSLLFGPLAFVLAILFVAMALAPPDSPSPIVTAPVPGPCGCGGRCCQVDSSLDSILEDEITEPLPLEVLRNPQHLSLGGTQP